MPKQYRFTKRCPLVRKSFESIKHCILIIERNDNAIWTINTSPAFLLLEKNETIEEKLALLAEQICLGYGVKSVKYEIV